MSSDSGTPSITLIGAGRLARAILRTMPAAVDTVLLRPDAGAPDEDLRGLTNRATADWSVLRDVTHAVVWIVTSDGEIFFAAGKAAQYRSSWEGITVVHSSGALAADVLAPLVERGARALALHPNGSFSGTEPIPPELVWSISSDHPDDLALAACLLAPVAPRLIPINDRMRPLYHAAASVAANYSVTLFDAAVEIYRRAGVPEEMARDIVADFITATAERARRGEPRAALTGPIARGDAEIVRRQSEAIDTWAPEFAPLFELLARMTREMLERNDRGNEG